MATLLNFTNLKVNSRTIRLTCFDYDVIFVVFAGLSMGMGFPWESSHGMGWDGTAHICISHGKVAMS